MRGLFIRLFLPLPLLLASEFSSQASAQTRSYGFGVGVGVGIGPGWGYGPWVGPLFMPSHYNGFWGNGMSMYGPPVPSYRPIPGVFGGADSQFFPIPPDYGFPGFGYYGYDPETRREVYFPGRVRPRSRPLPDVNDMPWRDMHSGDYLPPDNYTRQAPKIELPALQPAGNPQVLPLPNPTAAEIDVEVALPTEDAELYVDGEKVAGSGTSRQFGSAVRPGTALYHYELRAEWKIDGKQYTHNKTISVRPGEKQLVQFAK
ncbi:MAG: TIGR03000 domain-containing protein [Zavarzinella sp.]